MSALRTVAETCAIRDLTPYQVKVLAAFAASWRESSRPPTAPEFRARGLSVNVAAIATLTTKGFLTCDWRAGRRLRQTLRPTQRAWELLGVNAVEGAAP